jgi:hypothetical protein
VLSCGCFHRLQYIDTTWSFFCNSCLQAVHVVSGSSCPLCASTYRCFARGTEIYFTEPHVLCVILQYHIIWICIRFLGKDTVVPLHENIWWSRGMAPSFFTLILDGSTTDTGSFLGVGQLAEYSPSSAQVKHGVELYLYTLCVLHDKLHSEIYFY